jgi:hypothetical protein
MSEAEQAPRVVRHPSILCCITPRFLPATQGQRWEDCKLDCSTWAVLYPVIFETEAEIIKKGDDISTGSTS